MPNGGSVDLGNTPHYSTFWLLRATAGLPGHRVLWAVAPYLMYLCCLTLLVHAVKQLGGGWPAALTFSIGLAVSPVVLFTLLPNGFRSDTWLASAALVWFLVKYGTSGQLMKPLHLQSLVIILILVTGVTLASDPLFLLCGVGPFAGSAALGWLKFRRVESRRLLLLSTGIVGGAIPLAVAISRAMHSLNFRSTFPGRIPDFVTAGSVSVRARSVLGNLLALGNSVPPTKLAWSSLSQIPLSLLVILGLAVPFLFWTNLLKDRTHLSDDLGRHSTLFIFASFWVLSGAALIVAFLFNTVSIGTGLASSRYLPPLFFATMSTAGLWGLSSTRRVLPLTAAGTLFCLLSLASQTNLPVSGGALPAHAPAVMRFLDEQGVRRGYASYWNSHSFSWQSGMKLAVYPVWDCPGQSLGRLCRFPLAVRSVWYERGRAGRSFLLSDPQVPLRLGGTYEEQFGPPDIVRRFGEVTVYIYGYDLASRMG